MGSVDTKTQSSKISAAQLQGNQRASKVTELSSTQKAFWSDETKGSNLLAQT